MLIHFGEFMAECKQGVVTVVVYGDSIPVLL